MQCGQRTSAGTIDPSTHHRPTIGPTTQSPTISFGSSATRTLHWRLRNWQSCSIWPGRGDIIEFPKLQPLVTAASTDLIWAVRAVGVAAPISNCRNCVSFLCLSFIIAPLPPSEQNHKPVSFGYLDSSTVVPSSSLSPGFTFDLAMNCPSATVD